MTERNRDRETAPIELPDTDSEPPTEVGLTIDLDDIPMPGTAPARDSEPPTEPGTGLERDLDDELDIETDTHPG